MPLGASKLNFISKVLETVSARTAKILTAVNNAQIDTANSQFGGASALFDGIDDYITVPNDGAGGDFDFGANDFTIEAWINMDTTSGTQNVLAWWSSTYGDGRSFFFGNSNGQLRFNYYTLSGTFRNVLGAGTLSANTWHHIAIVGDSTNFKTYIDGTNAATASRETIDPISGTNPCSIGATNYGAFDFDGHIDELRVSSSARYTANFTPSTSAFTNDSDTVLLMHADGTDASTTFTDDNGTRAQVGLSAVNNAQVDTAQSKFGGASALFDGTDDQINASDSAFVYGTNDLTIEFWFRVAVNNVNQSFVGNRYSTFLNDHWFISLRGSTGDVQLQIQTAADYRTQILTSAVNTNTWYHFAAVRDGNTFEVFLDGVSQGTGTNTGSIGTSDLYIGSRGDLGLDVNGHIDELRISSVARYTANFTPQTSAHVNDSDTILLAHMNGTDGSTTFTDDNS
jgi:hypothetical protein